MTSHFPELTPGHLKLELAIAGARLHESIRRRQDIFRVPQEARYVAREVDLILPDDVWVSVPVEDDASASSPFTLLAEKESFVIERKVEGKPPERTEVRLLPQPEFYGQKTTKGTPMWQVGTVRGGYITITPTVACGFTAAGRPCEFCQTGVKPEPQQPIAVEEVIEVVDAAFQEGVAEFVSFNTAFHDTEDGGVLFLEPYVRGIKRHFYTLVAAQFHPPRRNHWIDRAYAEGVDALSYNVEIFEPHTLRKYCAGRVKYIGRERYFEALRYAASIFPGGTVWSDLVVGIEPPASTMKGIDTLTSIGVLPVLSIFRPRRDLETETELPKPTGIGPEETAPIFAHLYNAVKQSKINMRWMRDLSVSVTPLEARFFAGDEPRLVVAMQHFYRSRLGTLTAKGLARLRRRLRVRTVRDSLDSSQL